MKSKEEDLMVSRLSQSSVTVVTTTSKSMAYLPQTLVLCDLKHDASESLIPCDILQSPRWRLKERMKTGCVALVMCLNITVDPPDVIKISPCAVSTVHKAFSSSLDMLVVSQIVSASQAGDIKFLDLRRTKETYLSIDAHRGSLTALGVHRHGPIIASGSAKQLIKVFSLKGEQLGIIKYHTSFMAQTIGPSQLPGLSPLPGLASRRGCWLLRLLVHPQQHTTTKID